MTPAMTSDLIARLEKILAWTKRPNVLKWTAAMLAAGAVLGAYNDGHPIRIALQVGGAVWFTIAALRARKIQEDS